MLRIFGYFSYNETIPKSRKTDMIASFKTNHEWHDTTKFDCSRLFILYEHFSSPEAKNYFNISSKKDAACFIVGNIHPPKENPLGMPEGCNLSKWIYKMYQDKSWGFVKDLRGNFNIILLDKNCLFLVNDRLGLSPMYILPTKKGCYFCNKVEPIAEMQNNHALDTTSVVDFLIYGFIPEGRTFFQGLRNQAESSVITIKNTGCNEKLYTEPDVFIKNSASNSKTIDKLREIFRESVAIRCKEKHIFSALTGGWDTRFIIANLLELKKQFTTYTVASTHEDIYVANILAKKFKLKHIIIQRDPLKKIEKSRKKISLALRFRTKYSKLHLSKMQERGINASIDDLKTLNFFTTPSFTGAFGTELMGNVPLSFSTRLYSKRNYMANIMFSKKFLKNDSLAEDYYRNNVFFKYSHPGWQNYSYCFLTQVGRSYLNSHYSKGWERPTSKFEHRRLLPFVDCEFITYLASLDGRKYLNYRAYSKIYEKYYPEFLKTIWTYHSMRKKSIEKRPLKLYFNQEFFKTTVLQNPSFKAFIKNNHLFKNHAYIFTHRAKELYFVFCWFQACNDLLRESDRISFE